MDTKSFSLILTHHSTENDLFIKGVALRRFQSYVLCRSFAVHLGNYSSMKPTLTYGVP